MKSSTRWFAALLVPVAAASWGFTAQHADQHAAHHAEAHEKRVPSSLRVEHEHLQHGLARALDAGGKTGAAARGLERVLKPHFQKEEEFALPPLTLLPKLAEGSVTPEMRDMLRLTEKLRAQYPQMLKEHKAIGAALKDLIVAAKSEGRADVAKWASELQIHAQHEEEIAYPAALLVGQYLKLTLPK